jgi:hypothetical protein
MNQLLTKLPFPWERYQVNSLSSWLCWSSPPPQHRPQRCKDACRSKPRQLCWWRLHQYCQPHIFDSDCAAAHADEKSGHQLYIFKQQAVPKLMVHITVMRGGYKETSPHEVRPMSTKLSNIHQHAGLQLLHTRLLAHHSKWAMSSGLQAKHCNLQGVKMLAVAAMGLSYHMMESCQNR